MMNMNLLAVVTPPSIYHVLYLCIPNLVPVLYNLVHIYWYEWGVSSICGSILYLNDELPLMLIRFFFHCSMGNIISFVIFHFYFPPLNKYPPFTIDSHTTVILLLQIKYPGL